MHHKFIFEGSQSADIAPKLKDTISGLIDAVVAVSAVTSLGSLNPSYCHDVCHQQQGVLHILLAAALSTTRMWMMECGCRPPKQAKPP